MRRPSTRNLCFCAGIWLRMKRRGQRGTKATFGRALREEVIARQAGDVFEAALANRELLQLATARMKKSPTTTQAIGLTMCVALARMSLIKPGGTSNLGGKPASHKPEHPKAASRVPSTLAKLTRDSVLETETSIRSGKSGRKKMERGRIGFALSCLWVSWGSDQLRLSNRTHLVPGGSVTRVAAGSTPSPAGQIAWRNAGGEVLRWGTRNGRRSEPSL